MYVSTNYCYFKCLAGTWKFDGPRPWPPHSSRPKCGWLVAFVYLHENTSNPKYYLDSHGQVAYMETHPKLVMLKWVGQASLA